MAEHSDWTRRALVAGGIVSVAGWVWGVPHLASLGRTDLKFRNLPDLAPFRRLLGTGAASSVAAPFVGIGMDVSTADPARAALLDSIRSDPCRAFFGPLREGDPLPVAMFSDFACPVCQVMETRLATLDPEQVRIVRHQLPILGIASETASRAVLAADLQNAYAEMHALLIRTPAVTDESYVSAVATDIGLDADRLLADMRSEAIVQKMRQSAALADVFGFYGTPAFAVGRTVFMGSLPEASLRELVEVERSLPVSLADACDAP